MKIHLNKSQKIKVKSSEDVFKIMHEILFREDEFRRKQEFLWVIGVSNSKTLEFVELVALGKLNLVYVSVRDVFSYAVESRAASIILVHNHPGGNLLPSFEDLDVTMRIIEAAKILGMEILDHVIITENDYMSFYEQVVSFSNIKPNKRKKTIVAGASLFRKL